MTHEELEVEVARLEQRVRELEARAQQADAWPPRPYFSYVPMGTGAGSDLPFHDPVLE